MSTHVGEDLDPEVGQDLHPEVIDQTWEEVDHNLGGIVQLQVVDHIQKHVVDLLQVEKDHPKDKEKSGENRMSEVQMLLNPTKDSRKSLQV